MTMERQNNEFSVAEENNQVFIRRFWRYLKERFPLLGHGVLVASFSFSAISYSRICRNEKGFIDWHIFLAGIVTTIGLFFLVRVFDEFKDKEEDAEFRKHLPVPRGLVSLKELATAGMVAFVLQVLVNIFFLPDMLLIYAGVFAYLLLMSKEFFVAKWLKQHPFWYVVSHMLIIPLIDVYASGLDWVLDNKPAPFGLVFFFVVSFMNGVVLEIGRKIKTPENEEINTYSTKMGAKNATLLWLVMICITFIVSLFASDYANHGVTGVVILSSFFLLCSSAGLVFLKKQSKQNSKWIEYASGFWTIAMYLTLGGVPMLIQFFERL